MQTHAAATIILAAVFSIAHHRMSKVCHVDTDLVLAACEQVKKKQRAAIGLFYQFPLGCGPLATIIDGAAHDHHALGIVEPTLDTALWLLHDTLDHSDITAVNDSAMPVGGHLLLDINALGINHETRSACIQAVDHMGCTALVSLGKMTVKHGFYIQAAGPYRHGQHTLLLINDNYPPVLIDDAVVGIIGR